MLGYPNGALENMDMPQALSAEDAVRAHMKLFREAIHSDGNTVISVPLQRRNGSYGHFEGVSLPSVTARARCWAIAASCVISVARSPCEISCWKWPIATPDRPGQSRGLSRTTQAGAGQG